MSANHVSFEEILGHLVTMANQTHGRGWKTKVDRRLSKTKGSFQKSLKRKTVRLRDFLNALEILRIEPASFFRGVQGNKNSTAVDPLNLLREQKRDRDAIETVGRIMRGLAFGTQTADPDFDAEVVQRIRDHKKKDPQRAREASEAALTLVRTRALSPRATFPLLLEWASCNRRTDRIEVALEAYLRAYEEAQLLGVGRVMAEVLLCLPEVVVRNSADFQLALQIADHACLQMIDFGDPLQTSKAMLVRGRQLFYLDRVDQAIASLRLALRFIPARYPSFLFAAHQNLAHMFKEKNLHSDAIYHLAQALEVATSLPEPLEADLLGTLHWTWAGLAAQAGDHEAADNQYATARQILLCKSPVSTALVSIDYAEYLLNRGQLERANDTIKSLVEILQPLQKYPIAESAVLQLIRVVLSTANLNSRLLREAASHVRIADSPGSPGLPQTSCQ